MSNLVKNKEFKIRTPLGMELFYGVQKINRTEYIHLKFLNGSELKCSLEHPIITIDGVIKAKNIKKTDEVITNEQEGTFVISKKIISKPIELFDIINSGRLNQYYTNNILSHNCNFLGSQSTLIDAIHIAALSHEEPIEIKDHLKIYARPQKERKYIITVDVAEGIEEDSSAFIIIDITEIPYVVVGVYSNNQIAPIVFPTVINKIAKVYNNALVMIELNARGAQVADIMHHELEYPNLLMTALRGRHGIVLGQGFSNKCKFGLVVNPGTKKLGCSNLKSLIETNKILITDFNVISELTTYIAKGTSFGADHGAHDDLVACLVVFAWISTQPYFRELTDLNTIGAIQDSSENIDELEILGGLDTGTKDSVLIDDNLIWNIDSGDLYEYGEQVSLWSF